MHEEVMVGGQVILYEQVKVKEKITLRELNQMRLRKHLTLHEPGDNN